MGRKAWKRKFSAHAGIYKTQIGESDCSEVLTSVLERIAESSACPRRWEANHKVSNARLRVKKLCASPMLELSERNVVLKPVPWLSKDNLSEHRSGHTFDQSPQVYGEPTRAEGTKRQSRQPSLSLQSCSSMSTTSFPE